MLKISWSNPLNSQNINCIKSSSLNLFLTKCGKSYQNWLSWFCFSLLTSHRIVSILNLFLPELWVGFIYICLYNQTSSTVPWRDGTFFRFQYHSHIVAIDLPSHNSYKKLRDAEEMYLQPIFPIWWQAK
jgi:hypothetical protein